MNITALASWFTPTKAAGHVAPGAANQDRLISRESASTIVTLSGGKSPSAATANLTYTAAPGEAASASPTHLLDQELLLPTRENVAKLAKAAGDAIGDKLDRAGIPRLPAFDLEIGDPNSAQVTVKSDRADARAIEAFINGDPQLQLGIHNADAIASHIPAVERSMAYQQEYRAAQTQQQIDQVNARYADLLGGFVPTADIGMHYGASGLRVTIDQPASRG